MPLVEDLRLLKSDENNPNKMSLKQQEQVWRSLQKYGWTYPIITNRDGVFADGEQRAQVYKGHGEFFAPVLRLPVSEVERRMLRQILNKLKGKHSRDLDEAEFRLIIDAGERADLTALLDAVGEKLPDGLRFTKVDGAVEGNMVAEHYELIIEFRERACLFLKMAKNGFKSVSTYLNLWTSSMSAFSLF